MKAGAYYWNGWSKEMPFALTDRLKREFGRREPIWGWINDSVENMEIQIRYATEGGLKFFAFDWYYPETDDKYFYSNDAVDTFLKSGNSNRMEFCFLVANHTGFQLHVQDWKPVMDIWLGYFRKGRYLKVDGKPLVIIFSPRELTLSMGGSDSVRIAFEELQAVAREQGFSGVAIAGCHALGEGQESHDWLKTHEGEGYTHFTGYGYNECRFGQEDAGLHSYEEFIRGMEPVDETMRDYLPKRIQPYRDLMKRHEEIWANYAGSCDRPYMPCITCGWDMRPWERPGRPDLETWYYPDRTPTQVSELVSKARTWMENHAKHTTQDGIALLYAWNELGEGGYLVPTLGDGNDYLDELASVLEEKGFA